jgi:aminoglycoside 6'-N-acetyltransferase I
MLELREFSLQDLEPCVKVFIKIFSREPWNDRWPSVERARQYLTDLTGIPGFRGYLALQDEWIVGLCFGHKRRWWQGDEYYVNEMGVDPDVQRSGVGSKLIAFAEGHLRAEGIEYIALLTERDIPAERFWHKQGYSQEHQTIFMFKYLI